MQEDGEVFVVQSRCPHREYPLDRGDISNGVITCPWHNMAFDLKNLQPIPTIDKEWLEKECAFQSKFEFELIVQYEHQQFELDFDKINPTD